MLFRYIEINTQPIANKYGNNLNFIWYLKLNHSTMQPLGKPQGPLCTFSSFPFVGLAWGLVEVVAAAAGGAVFAVEPTVCACEDAHLLPSSQAKLTFDTCW